jgi:hypothetical protein
LSAGPARMEPPSTQKGMRAIGFARAFVSANMSASSRRGGQLDAERGRNHLGSGRQHRLSWRVQIAQQ